MLVVWWGGDLSGELGGGGEGGGVQCRHVCVCHTYTQPIEQTLHTTQQTLLANIPTHPKHNTTPRTEQVPIEAQGLLRVLDPEHGLGERVRGGVGGAEGGGVARDDLDPVAWGFGGWVSGGGGGGWWDDDQTQICAHTDGWRRTRTRTHAHKHTYMHPYPRM